MPTRNAPRLLLALGCLLLIVPLSPAHAQRSVLGDEGSNCLAVEGRLELQQGHRVTLSTP